METRNRRGGRDRIGDRKRGLGESKGRSVSGDPRIEVDDEPELRAGRFVHLGDPRRLVQRLNEHVVVARFARGHLGIVGHYRQAHIEAGPFGALGEARAAWIVIRRELEAFRKARLQATSDAGPAPSGRGTGWIAQARYVGPCGECRSRSERRGQQAIRRALRAAVVRRRAVSEGDAAGSAAGRSPAFSEGAAVVDRPKD